MPIYKLNMIDDNSNNHVLQFDSDNNYLFDENFRIIDVKFDGAEQKTSWERNFAVSPENPAHKVKSPKRLKIQLGLKCNYECSYCSQSSYIPDATITKTADVKEFLANIDKWFEFTDEHFLVEFWGGEPLLYWKKIMKLVVGIHEKYPQAHFSMITNGSLLDEKKLEFLLKYDFGMAISHDGPGQYLRGPDPFEDEKLVSVIKRVIETFPKGKLSFNSVLTKDNNNPVEIMKWFHERLGEDAIINFEGVVNIYDDKASENNDFTQDDYSKMTKSIFEGLKSQKLLESPNFWSKANAFIRALAEHKPYYSFGQKCGMDRPDQIAVDLKGNVMTCQNTGAQGEHNIGHLDDFENIKLNTAVHFLNKEECNHCPVVSLCAGSCMFLDGNEWVQSCNNEFHYNMGIFAGTLYLLTGLTLVGIEGDIKRPVAIKKKKVIPIKFV